ncbi:IS21 family transposase [Chondrinema litorale]|uniref:IS21 family transposase n=1 Tax=Chondrinema litorale TaxID=2994555 RepID=UPI003D6E285D
MQYTREGKSQRQISAALGISRRTVKKYILLYDKQQALLANNRKSIKEQDTSCLRDYLSSPPKYNCPKRPKKALTIEVQQEIDYLLDLNATKRKEGLHKQVLKKCDILSYLQQKGYKIGYTTVCGYIKQKQKRNKEAFIRQKYAPATSCEFDWGEAKLLIAGKRKVLQLAVFTSSYSNYRFAYLYHRQDTLAFMDAHVKFFEHTAGVYHQMVYDNMRIVVARFIGKNEAAASKEPTQALCNLKAHYRFTHRFCNAGRGNEKGLRDPDM